MARLAIPNVFAAAIAVVVVAASPFWLEAVALADSSTDFSGAMFRAYAAEASNAADRSQWQHDVQRLAGKADLNRMTTIGSPSALARRPSLRSLFFRPPAAHAYTELARIAADAVPGNAIGQRLMLRLYESMVDSYNADRRVARYFVPQARFVFLQAAYRVYNGDRLPDATASHLSFQALIYSIAQSRAFARLDAGQKQAAYERYIVTAGSLLLASRWATEHRDDAMRAQLKRLAHAAIMGDLGHDPASLRFDELPCVIYPFAGTSCAQQLRIMRGEH